VDHEFLNRKKGFVAHVGISVTEQAHDDRLAVQLLQNAESKTGANVMRDF
jgi:hypothetical protein